MSDNNTPSYIADAKPAPQSARAPWFKNTAPAYAGILLWFVFWSMITTNNLVNGLVVPIAGVVIGALVCHFLFYLPAGLFGMKTGLPLAVIGSSMFGEKGGIIMPGLLMGILQFGWLAVNSIAASGIATTIGVPAWVVILVWGSAAVFIGLKGIKYVAGISTYLPLVPLAILIYLFCMTVGSAGDFDPELLKKLPKNPAPAADNCSIIMGIIGAFVAFFATAGAAGVNFGTGSRNTKDVQLGGLVGIAGAMIFTCVIAIVILAGAYGNPAIAQKVADIGGGNVAASNTALLNAIVGGNWGEWLFFALAVVAFPSACFSSLIAADSFKSMLPKVNSTLSVTIAGAIAIALAIIMQSDANAIVKVLNFIGVSFGPICGAIFVEYFLCKGNWGGPRKSFNPAGWLAWAVGFVVGLLPTFGVCEIPMTTVITFAVGAVVYWVAMLLGLKSANTK